MTSIGVLGLYVHDQDEALDFYVNKRKLTSEIEAHKRTLAELDSFNYSVSHDLRAPLRPLEGFSQALLEDWGDKLDDKAKDYLTRIRTAAVRMSQLIDDLSRLSRLGRGDVRRESVDLGAMAESIMSELRTSEPEREIEFVAHRPALAEGDPGLLLIVLENLLRNAWKFSHKKQRSTIEFGQRRVRDETVYLVRDEGVGFDPRFASRLFQPFQRLHSIADFEGTGIGLAIVNRIVGRHGGRIWAESGKGEGATFFFTLESRRIAPDG